MKLRQVLPIAVFALATFVAQSAQAQTSDLQIVHGINGLDVGAAQAYQVDVAIDGSCDVADAIFDDVTAVAAQAAGTHKIEVFTDDVVDCTGALLFEGEISLAAGGSSVAILHLDQTGTPTISQANFPLDFEAGRVRIAAFHGAWAAPFTFKAIFVDKTTRRLVYNNLANGEASYSGKVKVGLGTNPTSGNWKLKASQSGASVSTIVPLFENVAYLFILVGNVENGTLDAIVAFEQP